MTTIGVSPSISSTSSLVTTSTQSPPANHPSDVPQKESGSSLSRKTAIGLGVGLGLGVSLMLSTGLGYYFKKRGRQQEATEAPGSPKQEHAHVVETAGGNIHEVSGEPCVRYELETARR